MRYFEPDWNKMHIDPNQDFHTLSSDQVQTLIDEADRVGYKKPKNANGSRARYFHARILKEYRAARRY